MKLGGIKVLGFRKPGLTVPMAAMVLALIPPIKWSMKFVNMKTWSGFPMRLDLLGMDAVKVVTVMLLMLRLFE